MSAETEITKVVFRKFDNGEIIALFPEIPGTNDVLTMSSYMHVGQHGSAHLSVVSNTKLATEEEYSSLKNELENIVGYNLRVSQRITKKDAKTRIKALNFVENNDNKGTYPPVCCDLKTCIEYSFNASTQTKDIKELDKDIDEIKDVAYQQGFDDGEEQGYKEGYKTGESEGYNNGKNAADEDYDQGHKDGFEEGKKEAKEELNETPLNELVPLLKEIVGSSPFLWDELQNELKYTFGMILSK